MQANLKAFNCGNCTCDDEHNAGFEKWYIPEIDFGSSVCLRWLIEPRSLYLLKLYNAFKNNHVPPLAGGWLDQPNVFTSTIETIDRHKAATIERENRNRQHG